MDSSDSDEFMRQSGCSFTQSVQCCITAVGVLCRRADMKYLLGLSGGIQSVY